MKITKRQLRKIIKEEIATINKDVIDDTVMDLLSDEGGAAGLEPLQSALEDLEDDEMSLPDESVEDMIAAVTGVKRPADGDYVDTTQLEGRKIKISKRQLARIIREEAKSTEKYDDDPALKGDQDTLPDHLQKGIIDKSKKSKKEAHHEMEESDTPHLAQYKAPQGSKRDKQLDATKADLASGDPERKARGFRRRQRMEDEAAKKNEGKLRKAIRTIVAEALSKATEDKIRKKAKERGMTFGSMKAEYKKGLAAWGSSGSRPGVSQHAWAMARINKANPSDDWSVVKKSKAKK